MTKIASIFLLILSCSSGEILEQLARRKPDQQPASEARVATVDEQEPSPEHEHLENIERQIEEMIADRGCLHDGECRLLALRRKTTCGYASEFKVYSSAKTDARKVVDAVRRHQEVVNEPANAESTCDLVAAPTKTFCVRHQCAFANKYPEADLLKDGGKFCILYIPETAPVREGSIAQNWDITFTRGDGHDLHYVEYRGATEDHGRLIISGDRLMTIEDGQVKVRGHLGGERLIWNFEEYTQERCHNR